MGLRQRLSCRSSAEAVIVHESYWYLDETETRRNKSNSLVRRRGRGRRQKSFGARFGCRIQFRILAVADGQGKTVNRLGEAHHQVLGRYVGLGNLCDQGLYVDFTLNNHRKNME
jgi:hypothetical protein